MTDETLKKRCSRGDKCVHPNGCWQPATTEHFALNKSRRDGFQDKCKSCTQVYREANRERANEYAATYRASHKEEIKEKNKAWRKANDELLREYRRENRVRISQRYQRYQKSHPEKVNEINRKSYLANLNKFRARNKVKHAVRSAVQRNLPNHFTNCDWQRALEYFNGCCAVCGRPLYDLFGTHSAAADHWIALTDPRPDNPGTVAINIVPLCHGSQGCNNSKKNHPAEKWLTGKFGKRRAREILRRIEAYFQWVREQDGGN